RVVECAGLEIRYTGCPYRGFDSVPFRHRANAAADRAVVRHGNPTSSHHVAASASRLPALVGFRPRAIRPLPVARTEYCTFAQYAVQAGHDPESAQEVEPRRDPGFDAAGGRPRHP